MAGTDMTIRPPTITAYFNIPAHNDTLFTLDDDVLGLLDTGGDLAGDIATDITGYGFDITIDRGRGVELDDIGAGTCRISLVNQDRRFDPSYEAGEFFGNLVPGKQVEVSIYGQTIFTGQAYDWGDRYAVTQLSTTSLLATDALAYLAGCEFDEWTTTPQLPGARITAVLDRSDVRWAGGRDLDAGVESLQGDNVSWGSNVLNYLQLVVRSDLGRLFASRLGVLTFRDRLSTVSSSPLLTFTDDGSGPDFSAVRKRTAAELLRTAVSIDREGGIKQTVVNVAARDEYGLRRLSIGGLLLTSDGRSLEMANFLAGVYSVPEDRIAALTVCVSRLGDSDQALVSSLELGDLIGVVWTPDGVGDPIERTCVVEGISHQIASHGLHMMTLSLSALLQSGVFTLDDDVLGLLDDGGVLAF